MRMEIENLICSCQAWFSERMIFWLFSLVWAQTTCPQTDLYAKGLDAYTIVIAEKAVSLNFQIDFSSEEEPYQIWRELLKDCGRSKNF